MKARVSRTLQNGVYQVSFAFSDFTADELAKMKSFGVPAIQLKIGPLGGIQAINLPLTQVNPNFAASFLSEAEAKNYEAGVLAQAKAGIEAIRQRKDDFSSTQEVDI